MPQRNPITLFLCRFVILYVLLVIPWPGLERVYSGWFRALGSAVFAGESGQRELNFEPVGKAPHPWYTRVVIVNRRLMHEDGSGPVRNLDLDALAVGWKPTALLLALIVASPIPWRRRGWALLWGMLCLHALILLFLGYCIWNDSTEVSLVILTPFWKHAAEGFKDFLLWQYTLVFPVVVWLLVTFRREDRLGAIGLALFGPAKGGGAATAEKAATGTRKEARK